MRDSAPLESWMKNYYLKMAIIWDLQDNCGNIFAPFVQSEAAGLRAINPGGWRLAAGGQGVVLN